MKTAFFFKLALFALEKLASRTDNTIDDRIVKAVKKSSETVK